MTARQSLDVSKEALETSRGSAAASRSSANTARDALALNREIFEYDKAKDVLAETRNKKRPSPDDSNGGDMGQCAPSTKSSNARIDANSRPRSSVLTSASQKAPAGVAMSEAAISIHHTPIFPSLGGVNLDFSRPSRSRSSGDGDGELPKTQTRENGTTEISVDQGTKKPSDDKFSTSKDLDVLTGTRKVLYFEPETQTSEEQLGHPDDGSADWEWDEENGIYRLWTDFVDDLAHDLTGPSVSVFAECSLLDEATIAALELNTEVGEVELPDSWWHLLHDRDAGQGWAGSREADMERLHKKFNA